MCKFVVGVSNKLAYDAVLKFGEDSALGHFLFVYGNSGCGKTHLLQMLKQNLESQGISVKLTNGDLIISELIQHLRNNGREEDFYQEIGAHTVLLVDDIHFLMGKEYSQKYFAKVLQRIMRQGTRVCVVADKKLEAFGWLNACLREAKKIVADEKYLQYTINIVEIENPDDKLMKNVLKELQREYGEMISESEEDVIVHKAQNIGQLKGLYVREAALRRLREGRL